ncbi:MAG: hypothetical protein HFH06_12245 [Lachnospiraceae bacterium]|nr:hypothetical protein [Lachnospiraceae bacterium]
MKGTVFNMTEQKKPKWMSDELVKDISPKKLDFLAQMFTQGQGKSQKEMMMFLMPMMKKAKQENLVFTPQEMQAAISAVKKYSTQEELEKINDILEKNLKKGGQ